MGLPAVIVALLEAGRNRDRKMSEHGGDSDERVEENEWADEEEQAEEEEAGG